jgi:hypothetical protein
MPSLSMIATEFSSAREPEMASSSEIAGEW